LLTPISLLAADKAKGPEIVSSRAISATEKVVTLRGLPAHKAHGPVYSTPPAEPDMDQELLEERQPSAPVFDDGIDIPNDSAVETASGTLNQPQSPGTVVIVRDSTLSPPAGFASNVAEPNVGSQGNGIFTTHNWYAETSTDNGSTYSYISPYTTFPNTPSAFSAGFCCDQRVAQDPSRDLVFWYLQYVQNGTGPTSTNGARIAVAHGQSGLASNTWTYYDFTPATFGLSNRVFDFPHLQASANYLYFTTNLFNANNGNFAGALIVRMPLATLDSGGTLTVDALLTSSSVGSIMAVSGAEPERARAGRTTMYFGALITTTSMRVYTWPESSSTPTGTTVTGLATTSTGTFTCTGPDSLNPCGRADNRMQTGWITDTELGFMWGSAQNGGTRPYPYTRVAILDPTTLAIVSQPDLFSTTSAWLYPALSVNERGHLGGTVDNLGGNIYPTIRAIIRDDLSPDVTTSGWETVSVDVGNSGTVARYGDYNGAFPHEQYPKTWLAAGHTQVGGSGNANSQIHNYWFGRERDTSPTLSVTLAGAGTGTVTSSPAGINCGATCSATYALGTTVTLTATPGSTSTFAGWSGACTGTGSCVVLIDDTKSVTATFVPTTLTVTKAGNGTGTVTSSPAGINCGADCSETYTNGTVVTLTATPDPFSDFTGWSGACTGTGSCVVTMDAAKSVTATFTLQTFALTVTKDGTGTGTVTSSPAGINCGADCSEAYDANTVVTLTATPGSFSTFTGWSGACSGTGSCVVTMDAAKSVNATFTLQTFALTVTKDGTGTGTVTSSPAGINCGADCSETYDANTAVTLTPTPDTFSTFAGWSGACSGTGSCVVTMDAAKTVNATFTLQTFALTVTKDGNGTGTVTSSPAGINCGADCSETYDANTVVTLTPTPDTFSDFTGWSGACSGTGSCVVTLDAAKTVNATFTLQTFALTVTKDGNGTGTVTSSPAGINCGADCSESYDANTVVTLTPTPDTFSDFTGWSGACSGTGSCVVTMDAAKTVNATFTLQTFALTVTKDGTGTGTVTSSPAGINCGGDCSETYDANTVVTLTPTPGAFSDFTGWSGACTGTGSCVVTMDAAKSVNATFTLQTFALTVTKDGNGTGTVTSSPAGINCGGDCSETYDANTVVTLTATPDTFSDFTGWSGACTGTGSCVVTLDAAKSVNATFTLQTFALTVAKDGTGTGTVTSSPAGIDCGGDCSESYDANTVVTLTATPGALSTFAGWSGACTGTGSCVVTMDAAKSVTATFTLQTFALTVTKDGSGAGTVTSSPAGINCGGDCSETYDGGTVVTLTATPGSLSTFAGWSGACSGTGSCIVTMDAAKSVNATFTLQTFTLTVTKSGTATGTVTSSPAGIDCGGDCSEVFNGGTMVTLTPTPDAGAMFTGWSGACTGLGSCVVTLDAAKSVNASFDPAGSLGIDLYTVTPCRLIDTRLGFGGPLASGVTRTFDVTGSCGIPADAVAIAINISVVTPSSSGRVTLFPGNESVPATSSLNYRSGVTLANNGIFRLSTDGLGSLAAQAVLSGGGSVDVVVDVFAYFK
jgi:hypothetical protein